MSEWMSMRLDDIFIAIPSAGDTVSKLVRQVAHVSKMAHGICSIHGGNFEAPKQSEQMQQWVVPVL